MTVIVGLLGVSLHQEHQQRQRQGSRGLDLRVPPCPPTSGQDWWHRTGLSGLDTETLQSIDPPPKRDSRCRTPPSDSQSQRGAHSAAVEIAAVLLWLLLLLWRPAAVVVVPNARAGPVGAGATTAAAVLLVPLPLLRLLQQSGRCYDGSC